MSDQPEVGALHVIVHGVVQGVGFRYFVLRRAQPLGLTGWVRNPDGNVNRAEGRPNRSSFEACHTLRRTDRAEHWRSRRQVIADFDPLNVPGAAGKLPIVG